MKALIIAAGKGSRLRSVSESKPLTPVAGITLIEHVITGAAAAGVREFIVVTGHQAERVEAFLDALARRLGLVIACVRTSDWNRANGHSVVAGADSIGGDYLLLMTDHLFDPAIPRRLLAEERNPKLILAVDRDLASPLIDLDDATRVETARDGTILRIGKALEPFDAIDTGIFRAGPALVEAIRADIEAGGDGSLSAGVQRLADQGRATTMDVAGSRWIDVDDPRALAMAEAMAQPAALTDSAA
jgi:choline kinase